MSDSSPSKALGPVGEVRLISNGYDVLASADFYPGYATALQAGQKLYLHPAPQPGTVAVDWRQRLIEDYRREYVGQGIEAWLAGLPSALLDQEKK